MISSCDVVQMSYESEASTGFILNIKREKKRENITFVFEFGAYETWKQTLCWI